jgi:DnaJ family protein C protein 17
LRIKQAKAERFRNYDNKRKNLVEELEAKEREHKKARVDKQKEEADRWHQTEKIKEEGRKLREEKEKELMRARQQQEPRVDQEEDAPPALGLSTSLEIVIILSDVGLKEHTTPQFD